MLNIPSSVKTLYQTDGVRKNFRVHFPNGEFADITNDNVVSESVKFTESLCSQSTFKFGLAEASVLEFETVGIGNMYGMTIEASIEIDCSSLSAADKAAIAAGTWDGTWDAVAEVFGIPLGTFRVDKCPRNHGAMAHRQVTAYSLNTDGFAISPVERFKLNAALSANDSYPAGVKKLIYANLGYWNTNKLTDAGYTLSKICDMSQSKSYISTVSNIIEVQVSPKSSPSTYTTFNITLRMKQIHINGTGTPALDELYNLDGSGYTNVTTSAVNTISSYYYLRQVNSVTTGEVKQFGGSWSAFFNYYGNYGCSYIIDREYNGTVEEVGYPLYSPSTTYSRSISCFYPTRGIMTTPYNSGYYDAVLSYVSYIYAKKDSMTVDLSPDMSKVILNQWVDSETDDTMLLKATLSEGGKSSFVDSYDLKELIQGHLEHNAQFAKSDRDGSLETIRLDNSSPESVLPDNYTECWWDEYDVDPIGTVTVAYQDAENKENLTEISIGTGQSRYDMSGNEVLKNLANTDLASVTSLINTKFAPYVGAVAFTPTELTMQGWPWLEAGDALEITAEDGTIVETYALRVEMSGIQHLQAVITAEGGEIIEEVS